MRTLSAAGRSAARDAEPRLPRAGRVLARLLVAVAFGAALVTLVQVAQSDTAELVLGVACWSGLLASRALLWWRHGRLTADLRRSELTFRTLAKGSPDPVVILDDRLAVRYASDAVTDLLGLDPVRAVGHPIAEVLHPDDAPALLGALGSPAPAADELAVRTARLRHVDGRWRLIQATVRDLRADPDVGALVLYCRDVTRTTTPAAVDSELLELALTDPETGLPNRAALVRRLGAVQREADVRSWSLALLGIDGLATADPAGTAGGTALRAVTARLTRLLRTEDWLARGKDGDFAVLVEGTVADAEVVAARLVAGIGPLVGESGPAVLTASAGVTPLRDEAGALDTGEALRRSDLALRSARAAGPGAVHRYDDARRLQQDRRSALRTDLDGALERGELRLVFQPVVDLVENRAVSVEALLRWRHPVFGDVSPAEFVPLAEETALITELGRWVLRQACATVAALPDPDLAVAVNVSAGQVRSGELIPDVLAALEDSGLPGSRLVVEITESVLLDDAHVIEDLSVLRSLGVRIAVDDFGTGWSSLAYLVGMPVDVLKMDQHFLANIEHDQARRAMCRAVLQLGTSLGLPVVVEGVTTPAVRTLLQDMGHRYLQGFLFSRPLEAGQLRDGGSRARVADPDRAAAVLAAPAARS